LSWLTILAALAAALPAASAQEAVESAYIRGHISGGDGIWRADDFGWFFYDLDKGQGGEQLRINVSGRTADKSKIVYSSHAWTRDFEYEPWGSYEAVAFLGKLYLAGYPKSDITDEVSSLGKGALRRILLDEKQTFTLTQNNTLPLQGGYALAARDVSQKNDVVEFVLLKNGNPVHAALVSIGGTFVYKIDDVPVILAHLANAMRSGTSGFAEIDAIFQVSDDPQVKLFDGGRLGNLELVDLSEDGFSFQNYRALSFIRNSVVTLTSDLAVVVVDAPNLYYYPEGGFFDWGAYEIRGPTFSSSTRIPVRLGDYNSSTIARWNAENYSGFYFNPEKALGAETLVLYGVHGRTVLPPSRPKVDMANKTASQDGFQYTTILQPRQFEYKPWGSYFVISFMGNQWFAGYDTSLLGVKATKSLLEHEYLGRVIMDSEMRGTTPAGNYTLSEGYEMRIRDVANDSIFVQLFRNGQSVDSSVVKSNSTYIYKKDLGDVEDLPILLVHVSSAFNNGSDGFATIDGIFQISDQYLLPVEPGLGMGDMEIVATQPGAIVMVSNDYINLNRDSTVTIGPGMNIRVADNDSLRYYLYAEQYVVPKPNPPLIRMPRDVAYPQKENFSMIVQAAEIKQVTADILNSSNRTLFSKDITSLARGSGELWSFDWDWNLTTLQLSDNGQQVLDADGGPVPALLYLNATAAPEQVVVRFDGAGRISSIAGSKYVYYVSPAEYRNLNATLNYDAMLENKTARDRLLKIELGGSRIQFLDVVDGRLALSGSNHTLQGTLQSLEPHARKVIVPPGRYELRARVENAVDAVTVYGEYFNVTQPQASDISLGSARANPGDEAVVSLTVPGTRGIRSVDISYDQALIEPRNVSGPCNVSWKRGSKAGTMKVMLPDGCRAANLTFLVSKDAKANVTTTINATPASGLESYPVINGTISIAAEAAKKSYDLGLAAALAVLSLMALIRRAYSRQ